MRRLESCTRFRVRASIARRGEIAGDCDHWADVGLTDRLLHHSIFQIAEGVTSLDLLAEYRHLSAMLVVDPTRGDVADLATLCAVAIARAQILERGTGGD